MAIFIGMLVGLLAGLWIIVGNRDNEIKELKRTLKRSIDLLKDSKREIDKSVEGTHGLKWNIPEFIEQAEILLTKK